MPFDVVHPHRLEGAGADVQGDEGMANSPFLERGKNVRVEMQARGRRGDCARSARIDGLIALEIAAFRLAADVGRQGRLAVRLEKSRNIERQMQVVDIAP